jgi:hypothetical protein
MFRAITKFLTVPALVLWGGCSVFGYSLAGPLELTPNPPGNADAWQIQSIGYNLIPPNFNGDVVTPKNLGEQYRWNTRNLYYAYDTSFLTYFGTNGAAQLDAMFAMLNSLSNVDAYSPTLSEWPQTSSRINLTAASVDMFDLKSLMLVEMMEQLGLAEPDRYTYTLHNRIIPAGAICPNYEYLITQRNFDPVTQNYSAVVNGVLYTYNIIEECSVNPNPEAPLNATSLRRPVDPEQQAEGAFSAVAAGLHGGLQNTDDPTLLGRFYTGLTRDDIGGLRYLLSSNTIVTEPIEIASVVQIPPPQPSVVLTSNLAQLNSDALTNNQAALQALYPALQITSAQNLGFAFVAVTNFVLVTNPPPVGSPEGTGPTVGLVAVVTSNAVPTFSYTFGNVITNFTFTNGGALATNFPFEYLLVPSNQCGFQILSNALTSVVVSTNTNGFATIFTNHALIVNIFSCVSNAVALREGIEKINFFRVDYDSLVGTNWGPVSNTYTLTAISNNRPVSQTVFRTIFTPDIIFSAADLAGLNGGDQLPRSTSFFRSDPNFNTSTVLFDQLLNVPLAGPGIIQRQILITLNKSGPLFEAESPSFLAPLGGLGNTNVSVFQWASFDGTTNAPVPYPVNTDYQNLVNNVFLQITVPGSLPSGNFNQPYSFELQASGATPPPYTYAVVGGSGNLPPGVNLTTSGANTFISGTPTATGIFDFVLQVTDTSVPPRTSTRNFSLEIDP